MQRLDVVARNTKSTIGTGFRLLTPFGVTSAGKTIMWRGNVYRVDKVEKEFEFSMDLLTLTCLREATVEEKLDVL